MIISALLFQGKSLYNKVDGEYKIMIDRITYIESNQTYPYKNLAVEEHLLLNCAENQCILYLWQNRNTIVIGRNQNAWKECLVSKLEADGGFIVRRLSGGGAVYHDLGNLNFTFLVNKENYDLNKQLQVIIEAVGKFGIKAERSGRNDILIEGRKFSGNAFYETGSQCYHHGTIMLNVNIEELSKYLTVSKEKLQSKGVDSVKSRVANLTDFKKEIDIEMLKRNLFEAFQEVYGLKAEIIKFEELDQEDIEKRTAYFASWDVIFGKRIDFQYEISKRFEWGQILIQFGIDCGIIKDVAVFSDAMKTDFIPELEECLKGCKYSRNELCKSLEAAALTEDFDGAMKKDVISWLQEVDL